MDSWQLAMRWSCELTVLVYPVVLLQARKAEAETAVVTAREAVESGRSGGKDDCLWILSQAILGAPLLLGLCFLQPTPITTVCAALRYVFFAANSNHNDVFSAQEKVVLGLDICHNFARNLPTRRCVCACFAMRSNVQPAMQHPQAGCTLPRGNFASTAGALQYSPTVETVENSGRGA